MAPYKSSVTFSTNPNLTSHALFLLTSAEIYVPIGIFKKVNICAKCKMLENSGVSSPPTDYCIIGRRRPDGATTYLLFWTQHGQVHSIQPTQLKSCVRLTKYYLGRT